MEEIEILTYEQLNSKTVLELETIKEKHLERIYTNEKAKQTLIQNILCLQRVDLNTDLRGK